MIHQNRAQPNKAGQLTGMVLRSTGRGRVSAAQKTFAGVIGCRSFKSSSDVRRMDEKRGVRKTKERPVVHSIGSRTRYTQFTAHQNETDPPTVNPTNLPSNTPFANLQRTTSSNSKVTLVAWKASANPTKLMGNPTPTLPSPVTASPTAAIPMGSLKSEGITTVDMPRLLFRRPGVTWVVATPRLYF